MKKILVFGIFFIFLFSLNLIFVSAEQTEQIEFDSYIENVDIISEKNVYVMQEIFVNFKTPQNEILFSLIPRISNLKVSLDDKELKCEIYEKIGKTDILCVFDESVLGKHFLQIEFDSSYPIIDLKDNQLLFSSRYNQIYETNSFIFILRLPLGYGISKEKDLSFYINPEANEIYSDGQRVILRWQEKPLNEKFEVSVISEQLIEPLNVLAIILALVLIIIILLLVFYFKKKIKHEKEKITKKKSTAKRKPKTETIEEYLMESEKKIIDELKNADKKELWQKQLQLKTEFSKAKLSRVIRNLEARNIIQKIPYGNTNKIKLKIS